MRLYDGESVEGFQSADIDEMKKEFHDEGMSGIDPRYVINRISSTIIRKNMESINAAGCPSFVKRRTRSASIYLKRGPGALFEFYFCCAKRVRRYCEEGSTKGICVFL
nr:hypothetical protein [Bacillus pumilus]